MASGLDVPTVNQARYRWDGFWPKYWGYQSALGDFGVASGLNIAAFNPHLVPSGLNITAFDLYLLSMHTGRLWGGFWPEY